MQRVNWEHGYSTAVVASAIHLSQHPLLLQAVVQLLLLVKFALAFSLKGHLVDLHDPPAQDGLIRAARARLRALHLQRASPIMQVRRRDSRLLLLLDLIVAVCLLWSLVKEAPLKLVHVHLLEAGLR